MRALLDTHALLWWLTDDGRLSSTARKLIADDSNEVFVSAASAWEIATKQRIGKLKNIPYAAERFPDLVAADGFTHLPITYLPPAGHLRRRFRAVQYRDDLVAASWGASAVLSASTMSECRYPPCGVGGEGWCRDPIASLAADSCSRAQAAGLDQDDLSALAKLLRRPPEH